MRNLFAFMQVAMLALWESVFLHLKNYPIAPDLKKKDAEAFPKTEASFFSFLLRNNSNIKEGSFPKTVIFSVSQTLGIVLLAVLLIIPFDAFAQDPVPGCNIGIVPDDVDGNNKLTVNLDETCTSCGIYGGDNGSQGMPPNGQTGCAIIQIREEALEDCVTVIVDPQATERTSYYFDYNLIEEDCFASDGTTSNQGDIITFDKNDLILNNGFYSLVVCSQSNGNRSYEVILGCCPNPGTGSDVTVCNGETPIVDLFEQLMGEDPGGEWTRDSGSGGIFDPMAGTFEVTYGTTTSTFIYTVEEDPNVEGCMLTSMVTVNIVGGNPGEGSETTVCYDSEDVIDLTSLLTGADPGGAWARESGTGGTFDAMAATFVMAPDGTTSTFSYTLDPDQDSPDCFPSALVTVHAVKPNSGEGSTVTVCEFTMETVNLFSLLTGADPGGSWSRESGMGGVFNAMQGTFEVTVGTTNSVFSYTLDDPEIRDCSSTTMVNVNIGDIVDPEVICDDIIVALSYNDPEVIDADSLIQSMEDVCGKIVSVQGLRVLDPLACGYLDVSEPADSVAFCCEDVGSTIMVQLYVTDDSDNTGSCMAQVDVVDNVHPRIMSCIDDITVSCSFDIDLNDLSLFGMMEDNQRDVDKIVLDDPYFKGEGIDDMAFDGMYFENCPDGTIIRETHEDFRECNKGNIERTFTIVDPSGNESSCTQVITVIDPERFDYYDITWPEDVPYEDCELLNPNPGPTPDPDLTGWPEFDLHDVCSQPMASYSDLIFDDPTSGCIKVQRRWKVIDWCYYNKDTKDGSWIYYQYIKIVNTQPPVFDDDRDTVRLCVPGAECAGNQTLEITATDDCTADEDLLYWYQMDVDNDGDIDEEDKINSFTIFLEQGTHRVVWKTEDRCGNYVTKEQIIEVRECKAPTPICYWGLAASLSEEGETVIWASDFNNKSNDNCADESQLLLSFSSDTEDTSLTLDCGDIGDVPIELWVTDKAGNQAFCETYIEVQDNHSVCGGGEMMRATVAGVVITESGTPVKDAQVNISGPELDDYQMTNSKGEYAFNDLDMHYSYEVIPVKDDNPLVGVSTLDLVMIQQHILGIRPLESPYKMIAADVNNSESISAIDLIQLRKMILGLHDAFPENNSWRFVESEYGILEEDKPWPFVEGMFVDDLSGNMVDNDFVAVKIGDVNSSAEEKLKRTSIEERSADDIVVSIEDQKIGAGTAVDVMVAGQGIKQLVALQWTITVDSEKLNFKGWSSDNLKINDEHIGEINGEGQHITLAWTDLDPISLNDGSAIITLNFEVLADGNLSDMLTFGSTITEATAYNAEFEKIDLRLEWTEEVGSEIALYQNAPNPFNDRTAIVFELPQDMQASFEIYDVGGKLIFQQNDFFNKGKNTIFVSADELDGSAGVVYYTLKTEVTSITRKMILLK